jgi:hypothetical protein
MVVTVRSPEEVEQARKVLNESRPPVASAPTATAPKIVVNDDANTSTEELKWKTEEAEGDKKLPAPQRKSPPAPAETEGLPSTEAAASSTLSRQDSAISNGKKEKCVKCSRRVARDGCTQQACLLCCNDVEGCESHRRPRQQAAWKEQVLAGTTAVQRAAAERRRLRIPAKSFMREPGFVYSGDTVVIWDIRVFASVPKWKEDALRKSLRRKKQQLESATLAQEERRPKRLRNSRKRFHRIMEERYRQVHLGTESKPN